MAKINQGFRLSEQALLRLEWLQTKGVSKTSVVEDGIRLVYLEKKDLLNLINAKKRALNTIISGETTEGGV